MATFRSVFSRGCDAGLSFFDAGITVVEAGTALVKEASNDAKDAIVDLIHAGREYSRGFREEAEAANSAEVLKERAKVAKDEALAECKFRREALKKRLAELGIPDEAKQPEQKPANVVNVGQELKGENKNG